MKEEECCLISSREALPQGWQVVAYITWHRTETYGYCTDSEPKGTKWTDGEISALRKVYVHARSGGIMPCKGEMIFSWPR